MYQIAFTKQATKSLQRLPRQVALSIREKLENIAINPFATHPNVTKLQNRPAYRLRVGDWRVIYEIQQDKLIILVLKVATRGDVYR